MLTGEPETGDDSFLGPYGDVEEEKPQPPRQVV